MTLELSELAARAAEVIAAVDAGERVQLTRAGVAVAVVRPEPVAGGNERLLGFAPGAVKWMAEDFTRPLPDDTWAGDQP